jgi:hypothetical protein
MTVILFITGTLNTNDSVLIVAGMSPVLLLPVHRLPNRKLKTSKKHSIRISAENIDAVRPDGLTPQFKLFVSIVK